MSKAVSDPNPVDPMGASIPNLTVTEAIGVVNVALKGLEESKLS